MHNKVNKNFKKIKKEFIKYIKEEYKLLIVFVVILLLLVIPTNYQVETPGSLLDVSKRIEVENKKDTNGSINITYVKSKGDSLFMYLFSYIIPSWDLEKKEEVTLPNEDYEDAIERGRLDLKSTSANAIYVAYTKANKKIKVSSSKTIITYVKAENSDLKVGDEILKINNKKINSLNEVKNEVEKKQPGEYINVVVKRDEKEKNIKTKLTTCENVTCIGILIEEHYTYKTSPKVKIEYKKRESGSSAGLMSTLYIYNSLINEDLSKGLKISGTGTIERDGSIGEIDGVKYKLKGAVKKEADVFIVPKENYKEAIKLKKENNYKIKIIYSSTFDELINKLEEM